MVKKKGFIVKTKLTKGKKVKFTKADLDKDGKIDSKDCNPYDPNKQDFGYTDRDKVRTYRGYNVDDYFYSGGKYHLHPDAKPVKKSLISRLFGEED